MSQHINDAELCAWLREHSSGAYRNAALAADRIEELLSRCPDSGKVAEALENAAQDVRYYLKHQNLPAWESASEYEKGVQVTAENIEKLIMERAEAAPAADSAATEQVDDDDDEAESAEDCWRRLALQFDGHRMQALGHLKCMVKDPQAHKAEAEKFLAAGPLSGEEVLAQRIAVLAAAPASADVGELPPRAWLQSKKDDSADCHPAARQLTITDEWKRKLIAEGGYPEEYAMTFDAPLFLQASSAALPKDADARVEKLAMSMVPNRDYMKGWNDCVDAHRAAQEGFALVPIDPPLPMAKAFRDADTNHDRFLDGYAAMLAVATQMARAALSASAEKGEAK